jgi:putative Ca2+/H+ antiporter (TMEM165/GDT1 family)
MSTHISHTLYLKLPCIRVIGSLFLLLLLWSSFVSADLFDQLDVNHDNTLDRAEYQHGLDAFTAFFKDHADSSNLATSWFTKLELTSLKGFWKAVTSAVAVILATEIGDKTFFIAAVLSMKHERLPVFSGAILALIIMTILSTAMGMVLPQLIDKQYTHILGGILFLYFGCKLVYDSRQMESDKHSEELEEVEEELLQQSSKKDEEDVENPNASRKRYNKATMTKYQVFFQSLTLTFLAEWGDRSQIATIALAAAKNPLGVMVGGCVGHSLCTGLAVVGGRMLASRISEKMVSQWGGIIFLIFGLHSVFLEE